MECGLRRRCAADASLAVPSMRLCAGFIGDGSEDLSVGPLRGARVNARGRSNRRLEIASVKCVACISGFEIRNRASDLDDSMPDALQERAGNASDADGEWCSACLSPFKYPPIGARASTPKRALELSRRHDSLGDVNPHRNRANARLTAVMLRRFQAPKLVLALHNPGTVKVCSYSTHAVRLVVRKEHRELLVRHRRAEEVSLKFSTAGSREQCALRLGFHAFGDNAQSQAIGHGDDRPDQRRIACVGFKIAHKGLVDLERGERKALEIAQGRVAGAEVIDGQIYPSWAIAVSVCSVRSCTHAVSVNSGPRYSGATPCAPSRSRTVRGNAGSVS